MLLRIGLFLGVNIAILAVLSIFMSVFGLNTLQSNGVDLDLRGLLFISLIIGMTGSFISLLLSKWTAKRFTGAQVITQPATDTERWLYDTTAHLSKQAGIAMPEIAIFPSPEPNAFATGARRNASLVAVSQGLLQHMSKDEVEAVIAHEIGHVANNDMVTLALIQGVVNTFVIFFARIIGHVVDRFVFRNQSGHGMGYIIVSIVAQIVLGILASTIVYWFSRRREFYADAAGAKLASQHKMIGALEKLRSMQGQPATMPESMAAFGIRNQSRSGWRQWFTTHPPLDDRIAALRQGRHAY